MSSPAASAAGGADNSVCRCMSEAARPTACGYVSARSNGVPESKFDTGLLQFNTRNKIKTISILYYYYYYCCTVVANSNIEL